MPVCVWVPEPGKGQSLSAELKIAQEQTKSREKRNGRDGPERVHIPEMEPLARVALVG